MSRVLNVVRLQLINKQTFVWVPLIILAGAVVFSILIYAMLPFDGPFYGGAGQAPLWYFFAIGLSALTMTFPFSQAMSITRREFLLGTLITAALGSLLLAVISVVGGLIEGATDGWGLNGYVFRLPGFWESGPLAAGLIYFAMAMFFFMIGFLGATIYKRWGATIITVIGVGVGLVFVGLVFLITRLDEWGTVGEALAALGTLGMAAWGLVVVAALAVISFLVLRRATP